MAENDEPRNRASYDTEEVYNTFTKLLDVSKYFRAYCYHSVVDLGFTRNEIDVLMSLKQHPEKNTVKGISETVHLSKGMISQAVESLRRKKYVTVNPDEKDRRSVLIHLCSISQPVLERLKEASAAFIGKIVSGISKEQLAQVGLLVTQVYSNKEKMKSPDAKSASENTIGGAALATSEHE
ncbi:MAG: winged helix-turn-helix transcriptional regulator [Clostridia bacterium]|nr:winged helix-turn-helix transcriptional regulator [Clostridia bacterium]